MFVCLFVDAYYRPSTVQPRGTQPIKHLNICRKSIAHSSATTFSKVAVKFMHKVMSITNTSGLFFPTWNKELHLNILIPAKIGANDFSCLPGSCLHGFRYIGVLNLIFLARQLCKKVWQVISTQNLKTNCYADTWGVIWHSRMLPCFITAVFHLLVWMECFFYKNYLWIAKTNIQKPRWQQSNFLFLLTTKTALNNWGMYVYMKCKRNYCFTLQNVTLCHFVQHSVLI